MSILKLSFIVLTVGKKKKDYNGGGWGIIRLKYMSSSDGDSLPQSHDQPAINTTVQILLKKHQTSR